MSNNTNSPAPQDQPWSSGRPSIRAYYPEIVLLTLVTIAFLALGVKLSCNVVKSEKNAPKEASVAYYDLSLGAVAYAQESDATAEEPAAEPVAVEEPVAEPVAVEEPVAEPVAVEEPVAEPVAVEEPVAEPVADAQTPPTKPAKSANWKKSRLILIWALCLGFPAALWIYRGCVWIVRIYGVYYELKIDNENPRATTFLVTRGVLNKHTDSVHIGQIRDLGMKQSFFQKYFKGGVGTVILYTPTDKTDPQIVMEDMSEHGRIFKALDDLRAKYWGRGGMQLNSGGSFDADGADVAASDGGDFTQIS